LLVVLGSVECVAPAVLGSRGHSALSKAMLIARDIPPTQIDFGYCFILDVEPVDHHALS
jgi:hypothetical protein